MRVIQRFGYAGERVVALGTFDGVHIGHRTLLNSAKNMSDKLSVPLRVCTFNRHPLEVIRPGFSPEQLSTIPEKAMLMSDIGVDEIELMNFNKDMADMEPEAFLKRLRSSVKLRAVVAGWNYTFGRGGSGNVSLLQDDGQKHGYEVIIEAPVKMNDGTVISSSLVREKLQEGNIDAVTELLGYRYMLTGTVAEGKHMGHRIGFPTANIVPWRKKALPRFGVYICMLRTNSKNIPALVNIGVQPTLPSGKVTVEAHALTENPELYGQKVRIILHRMLRTEKRFDSIQQLRDQIEKDRIAALKSFDMA